MKVFFAGATGVLGRRAVPRLIAAGHAVTGVARSEAKAELLRGLGARPLAVDLFDAAAVVQAVEGHDAVVHAATSIPSPATMARRRSWATNDRLRAEATPLLVAAAEAAGVAVVVKESITFTYADGGDTWLDETAPVAAPEGLNSSLVAEAATAGFSGPGRRGVVLRYGLFYGPDSDATVAAVRLARTGVAAALGPPGGYLSAIHTDDAASALAAALDVPAGIYNVVDDEPLTRAAHFAALAAALGRGRLRFPPAVAGRLSGPGAPALARSQRVSNRHFRQASGWAPAYPSVREGWPVVVRALAPVGR